MIVRRTSGDIRGCRRRRQRLLLTDSEAADLRHREAYGQACSAACNRDRGAHYEPPAGRPELLYGSSSAPFPVLQSIPKSSAANTASDLANAM